MHVDLPVLWLIIFVLLVLFEVMTLGLATIWFAIGALVAFFVAVAGGYIYLQLILFVLVSGVLLVTTRPIFVKMVQNKKIKTNAESLVGKTAVVTVPVDNLGCSGAVMINGVEWTARSVDNSIKFDKDEIVKIKEIDGVKLIIEQNN